MLSRMNRPFFVTALAVCGLALSACQSDKHTMVEPKPGTAIVCKECYNEVYTVTHWTGSKGGVPSQQMHTRMHCPSCKTEMSIYSENGVLMVKCAKCAPEGLACDKCLPPKGYASPKTADEPTGK